MVRFHEFLSDERDENVFYSKSAVRTITYCCLDYLLLHSIHTVNFGSEMVWAKHVSGKNIFCSMNKEKIMEERIFEILLCPFKGRAKLHHLYQQNGPVGPCQLGGNSKGQCATSKILFPLLLHTFIEQNIFFPETCFAYSISEPKFMVWPTFVCQF